jgi:3-methyladenine DNA glycosylase/8-oxoguanine DNA glycosylase
MAATPSTSAGGLAFDADAAVVHLRAADKTLARTMDKIGPLRLELRETKSVFVALAEAIVYQQLHGRAAAAIFGRLAALSPRSREKPSPKAVLAASDETLRGVGLSRAKASALRDLAAKTQSGLVPAIAVAQALDDEEIVEHLTQVRGIGRWTAEMFLIFSLGRPDVLPVDDYGIRKGFAVAFKRPEMPPRADITKRGERWRPYRTAASWYLWRAAEGT